MTVVKHDSSHFSDTRRQRNKDERRRRILQAATELFHEKGYEATSTDEIAERADVAKGTLFVHARSKAGLLILVYESALCDTTAQAFRAISRRRRPAAALAAAFQCFMRMYEQAPDLARHFLREQLFSPPEEGARLAALTREFIAALAERIEAWKAAGRVRRDVPALLAAQTSFALYYSVLAAWLSGHVATPSERDALLADSLELHWRCLEREDGGTKG